MAPKGHSEVALSEAEAEAEALCDELYAFVSGERGATACFLTTSRRDGRPLTGWTVTYLSVSAEVCRASAPSLRAPSSSRAAPSSSRSPPPSMTFSLAASRGAAGPRAQRTPARPTTGAS
jgi:hypothetical protein